MGSHQGGSGRITRCDDQSAAVALIVVMSLAVLVRLDEILYQFIGCAGRARLEAVAAE